jgi:GR25 family glycosyltransferase involved in LPS biosynthesis
MQCFVIHLAGSEKRAANVARLQDTLEEVEVFPAVRGADLPDTVIRQVAPGTRFRPHYPFPMGLGEIGCFLSHRACWQEIVSRDLPGALIAEDDLSLGDTWSEARAQLVSMATPEHFVRLPAKDRESASRTTSPRVFLPRVIGLQTVFQYVGQGAARRLLDASERMDRPVDTFLQMHWVHGQRIHTILPNGVSELTEALGGSTIQKKRAGLLGREVKRFIYRRRVAARPQV